MNFHFNVFNHCEDGRRCIEDLTRILSAQLRVLGHIATASPRYADLIPHADGLNVLYESFADPGTLDMIATAHARDARFVYVATEEPTPAGAFNGRLDNAMDARQAAFPEAARYVSAIWHLAPGEHVTRWFARFAPAVYVELGYADELRFQNARFVEPEFDYGFYGQLTPRRQRIIEHIGGTWHILPFIELSAAERDAEMRRVRIIPQIRAHDSQGIISSSRCATALHLGRPVVAEPHAHPGAWKEVIYFSETEEAFLIDVRFAPKVWCKLYPIQLEHFRRNLSPTVCLNNALALL